MFSKRSKIKWNSHRKKDALNPCQIERHDHQRNRGTDRFFQPDPNQTQLNVQNQIYALQALCERLPILQYEKQPLTVRCNELEQENTHLEQKYESLQSKYNILKQVTSELNQEQEQEVDPEQSMV